jgi:hypothetical protein
MIDKLGHGTEEVGALVGLQFITGPMITHVIERYVIEPMIEESSGGAIDEDELEKVMVMLGSGSPGADNALLVNISISVLEKLFHEGRLSPEGYKRIVIRVWNGDIEAGELYKAGGPASAPFSDNPMNGPRNGLVTTLADYGSNYQIPGLPDGVNHITQLDIIKNWVYFEGLMGLSRNRLIKAIGGMIPDELINTLAQGGMGLVNLSKMVNPAAVLRIPQGMFNRSGNDLKITMLSKAWEKLDMAKNH